MLRLLVGCALIAFSSGSFAESTWSYDRSEDEMTGQKEATATLESVNSLNLSFPYQGMNTGELAVRKHPRYGLNIILSIRKGQIVCGIDQCSVLVRFDNAPPVKFSAVPPADHSSTAIFLQPEGKFVALARKAHDIRVQVTIYQNGAQVLQFHSAQPLAWPPK